MKKIIFVFVLALMLGAANMSGKPRSAYSKSNPTAVAKVDSAINSSVTVSENGAGVAEDEFTGTSEDSTDYEDDDVTYVSYPNPDVMERFVDRMADVKTLVAGTIFIILVCLLPFVFLVIVAILFYKNRKKRYEVMAKAIESGQPIPEPLVKTTGQSDEYLWRKGIKNLFLGLGIAATFAYIDMNIFCSVGLLLLFYGLGQMAISYASANDLLHRKKKDDEGFTVDE